MSGNHHANEQLYRMYLSNKRRRLEREKEKVRERRGVLHLTLPRPTGSFLHAHPLWGLPVSCFQGLAPSTPAHPSALGWRRQRAMAV
jgi:hypothetical protein